MDSGLKWAPLLCGRLKQRRLPAALNWFTSTKGLAEPWHRLSERLINIALDALCIGAAYLVSLGLGQAQQRR